MMCPGDGVMASHASPLDVYRKLVSSMPDSVEPYLRSSCCLCIKILLSNHMPNYCLLNYSSLIFDFLCAVLSGAARSCSDSAK